MGDTGVNSGAASVKSRILHAILLAILMFVMLVIAGVSGA
jgi:hypothetical protein